MNNNKTKIHFLNRITLQIIGILIVFFAAVLLLWHGNYTSNQAEMAMTAEVYFAGEYRIAGGEW